MRNKCFPWNRSSVLAVLLLLRAAYMQPERSVRRIEICYSLFFGDLSHRFTDRDKLNVYESPNGSRCLNLWKLPLAHAGRFAILS